MSVTVTNRNAYADDVIVLLWPVGGNVAPQTYAALAPGEQGTVSFPRVAPGEHYVETYGATEFVSATSAPFTVGG